MKYVTPLLTNTFEYKVGEGFSIAPYQEIIVGTVADVGILRKPICRERVGKILF